mmetsp:Transcript_29813/g.42538  ORF Transcript_29813/g.42538 Transcript_29813/m.42538 type:complete len:136 (+) Transcript_29813:15-422(+)
MNGVAKGSDPVIYHMCDVNLFNKLTSENGIYYSPTFEVDKFIHATENPAMLLEAGTHFYKDVVGDWMCLKLNPSLLSGPVVYEAPAPVGNVAAKDYENSPKFPHIYGGIPLAAVLKKYKIIRGVDGTFLSIDGLC